MFIFQTDTVIGIGDFATDCNRCKRLNVIKGRDPTKPLQVIFANVNMILNYVEITNSKHLEILKRFLPGPFTFIVPVKSHRLCNLLVPQSKLGIRIPKHKALLSWVDKIGVPIAATSANLHGEANPARLEDVPKILKDNSEIITKTFTQELDPKAYASGIIELNDSGFIVKRYHPAVEKIDLQK